MVAHFVYCLFFLSFFPVYASDDKQPEDDSEPEVMLCEETLLRSSDERSSDERKTMDMSKDFAQLEVHEGLIESFVRLNKGVSKTIQRVRFSVWKRKRLQESLAQEVAPHLAEILRQIHHWEKNKFSKEDQELVQSYFQIFAKLMREDLPMAYSSVFRKSLSNIPWMTASGLLGLIPLKLDDPAFWIGMTFLPVGVAVPIVMKKNLLEESRKVIFNELFLLLMKHDEIFLPRVGLVDWLEFFIFKAHMNRTWTEMARGYQLFKLQKVLHCLEDYLSEIQNNPQKTEGVLLPLAASLKMSVQNHSKNLDKIMVRVDNQNDQTSGVVSGKTSSDLISLELLKIFQDILNTRDHLMNFMEDYHLKHPFIESLLAVYPFNFGLLFPENKFGTQDLVNAIMDKFIFLKKSADHKAFFKKFLSLALEMEKDKVDGFSLFINKFLWENKSNYHQFKIEVPKVIASDGRYGKLGIADVIFSFSNREGVQHSLCNQVTTAQDLKDASGFLMTESFTDLNPIKTDHQLTELFIQSFRQYIQRLMGLPLNDLY